MAVKVFPRGLYVPENKEKTSKKATEVASVPEEVVIHLWQHTGAPCNPLVQVGERVLVGQKIGDTDAFCSAPVHSSVSGEVIAIEPRLHFTGNQVLSVIIKSDGKQEEVKHKPVEGELTPEKIRAAVREAGLVGLGGAAFPTHVKLSPPKEKTIDTIIINGSECEPFITCDERNMLERTEELVDGCKLIMQVIGVKKAYIGIEMNKLEAIEQVEKAVSDEKDIKVVRLDTKYPQGAEKHLIKTVLDKEVPSGGLPMDVGVIVQNVGTTIAISEAIRKGKPLYERCLTVSGSGVKNPKNLRVKIGTPIGHLIEECGGFQGEPAKIVMGGPMTGHAQFSLDVPVVKGTSGIIVFTKEEVKVSNPRPCFRCGQCIKACPIFLMPNFIGTYIEAELIDKVEALSVMDCIECGLCAYICPAERPLIQLIKYAKGKILNKKKQG